MAGEGKANQSSQAAATDSGDSVTKRLDALEAQNAELREMNKRLLESLSGVVGVASQPGKLPEKTSGNPTRDYQERMLREAEEIVQQHQSRVKAGLDDLAKGDVRFQVSVVAKKAAIGPDGKELSRRVLAGPFVVGTAKLAGTDVRPLAIEKFKNHCGIHTIESECEVVATAL